MIIRGLSLVSQIAKDVIIILNPTKAFDRVTAVDK